MKIYSVKELSELSGVTSRTLRYYDDIGLLVPKRKGSGAYRTYDAEDVSRLQEILLLRELGIELSEIKNIIDNSDEIRSDRLLKHLSSLEAQKNKLDILIKNVKKTIKAEKGEVKMKNEKKFEGLKRDIIEKNESEYGNEIRKKYGNMAVDESNEKILNLTKNEYDKMQELGKEINRKLEEAVTNGIKSWDKESLEIAELHKKWLMYTWTKYDSKAHAGLAEMYVLDSRFKEFYDSNIDGCAEFLCQAIKNMTDQQK